jgi:broad specificity phosphatase PhoE
MILFLIRHGDNESLGKYLPGQKPGIHLNEHGLEQAVGVAESLAGLGITRIFTSPLERAMETGQPLANTLGLPLELAPDLIEMNAGDLTGLDFETLKENTLWQDIRKAPAEHAFPHGESFRDASARLWNWVEHLHRSLPEEGFVAAFSHADCIKMIVAQAMQMPLACFPRLEVMPASLTILGFKKETYWLGGMNIQLPYVVPGFDARNQHTIKT